MEAHHEYNELRHTEIYQEARLSSMNRQHYSEVKMVRAITSLSDERKDVAMRCFDGGSRLCVQHRRHGNLYHRRDFRPPKCAVLRMFPRGNDSRNVITRVTYFAVCQMRLSTRHAADAKENACSILKVACRGEGVTRHAVIYACVQRVIITCDTPRRITQWCRHDRRHHEDITERYLQCAKSDGVNSHEILEEQSRTHTARSHGHDRTPIIMICINI